MQKLQKLWRKSKNPEEISELKDQLSWIVSLFYKEIHFIILWLVLNRVTSDQDKQMKSNSSTQKGAAILAKHKQKEREAAKQGKKPFYIKKCMYLFLSPLSFYYSCYFQWIIFNSKTN